MNGDIYKQNTNWKSGNCSGFEVVKSRDLQQLGRRFQDSDFNFILETLTT